MIISNDIKPDRDLYFLGGKVIQILIASEESEIDYFDLFQKMSSHGDITISLYTLTLDWLFIIGVIENAANGRIRKCF